MIFSEHIIPEQNTVGREKDHKLCLRVLFYIRADIHRQIGFHRLKIGIPGRLLLHLLRGMIIVQNPFLTVIFLRPPTGIYIGQIRGIGIRQRTKNIVQQHVFVQKILDVV